MPYHLIKTTNTQYYDYIYNRYSSKLHTSYNLGRKPFSSHALKEKEVYMVTFVLTSSTNLSVCDMAKVVNSLTRNSDRHARTSCYGKSNLVCPSYNRETEGGEQNCGITPFRNSQERLHWLF